MPRPDYRRYDDLESDLDRINRAVAAYEADIRAAGLRLAETLERMGRLDQGTKIGIETAGGEAIDWILDTIANVKAPLQAEAVDLAEAIYAYETAADIRDYHSKVF